MAVVVIKFTTNNKHTVTITVVDARAIKKRSSVIYRAIRHARASCPDGSRLKLIDINIKNAVPSTVVAVGEFLQGMPTSRKFTRASDIDKLAELDARLGCGGCLATWAV